MELELQILSILGVSPHSICRKAYGKSPPLTYLELVHAIISTKGLPFTAKVLNIHENTLLRLLKKLFPDIEKGRVEWGIYFLSLIGLRKCNECGILHPVSNFYTDTVRVLYICKECDRKRSSIYRSNNVEVCKERQKQHYKNNKESYITRNIKYKTHRELATPPWANIDIIRRIYDCAEGDHVDHIIPLQGDLVCGLHVETNMQYLSPEDNKSKGSRFIA